MASCRPTHHDPGSSGVVPPRVRPGPAEIRILAEYYGTGHRFRSALRIYGMMKALAAYWAPKIDFGPMWRNLISLEWLSHCRMEDYIEGKLYRDHIFHPAAVAMLGWQLLGSLRTPLRKRAVRALQDVWGSTFGLSTQRDWENVLERAWLLASLFHDHGCPQELIAKCDFQIRRAQHRRTPYVLADFAAEADLLEEKKHVGCAAKAAIVDKLNLDRRRKPRFTHAPVSALGICWLREHAATDLHRAIVDLAADAVLWHHSTGKDYDWRGHAKDFRMEEHPLRYLLVLCDGLHEFCRELLVREEDKTHEGRFVTEFRESCTEAKLTVRGKELDMVYHVNCADQICETRWQLDRFASGLANFEEFVNHCHDGLTVRCSGDDHIVHDDCGRCEARKRRRRRR